MIVTVVLSYYKMTTSFTVLYFGSSESVENGESALVTGTVRIKVE